MMQKRPLMGHRRLWQAVLKWAVFNVMFLPMVLFFPQLLFLKPITGWWLAGTVLLGQAAWFLFDMAYDCFQATIWGRIRGRLPH